MGQLITRPWQWIVGPHWSPDLPSQKTLDDNALRYTIVAETGFSARQVDRIYRRFCKLDRGSKGYLTQADIEVIPGMSHNPFAGRIARAMADAKATTTTTTCGGVDEGDSNELIRITFHSFCKAFSHFKAEEEDEDEEKSILERLHHSKRRQKQGNPIGKLRFIFEVMDEEGKGHMSEKDIFKVLRQVRPGDAEDDAERMSAEIMAEGIERRKRQITKYTHTRPTQSVASPPPADDESQSVEDFCLETSLPDDQLYFEDFCTRNVQRMLARQNINFNFEQDQEKHSRVSTPVPSPRE